MRHSLLFTVALATAATVVAPTFATARHYYHYGRYYYSGYWSAPYGHAVPHVNTPYGRFPSYTRDPDPRLRAMLRSDFNRGVDAPGR
jgi:hypothetical protein